MDNLPSFDETRPVNEPKANAEMPAFDATTPMSGEDAPLPSFDQTVDQSKFETPGQEALAALEGAGHGFAGPLASAAEAGLTKLGVPGLSPEEQEARAAANPAIHAVSQAGGTVGGLLSGVGEFGILSKGAEAAAGIAGLTGEAGVASKVASSAFKGLIEMSGMAAGDEVDKQILGRGNPEDGVGTALANVGAQGLFGALTGGALSLGGAGASKTLKAIGNTKAGNYLGQLLEDFGARWKFNQENPSMVDSVFGELKNFHESTSEAAGDVYGSQGLKTQAIEKLTQKITPDQLTKHVDQIEDIFKKVPREIKSDPLFSTALMDWQEAATKPGATPTDVFKATDMLKRQFQEWGEYNKDFVPIRDIPFRNAAKTVGSSLKDSLENTSVWGDAGDLQKGVNKAFSEYIAPLKDFRSRFTTKIEGTHVVDPQKIKTYVNMAGKTGADVSQEIRPQMMKNYIEAAEKYRGKINDLYALNGIESPITGAPLDVTKRSYGNITPGGKLADDVFHDLIGHATQGAASAGGIYLAHKLTGSQDHENFAAEAGAGLLGSFLGKKLGPTAETLVGGSLKNRAVPFLLKMLESNRPSAWGEALEHARNLSLGDSKMEAAVNSIFTGGKLAGLKWLESNDKDREKIKKFISDGGMNQQIENSLHKSELQTESQSFAHGGMVEKPKIKENADPAAQDSKLSQVYPEQAMLMTQAKGRLSQYLNSVRPIDAPAALPFDEAHKDPHKERQYEKAITIADKPLSVMKHIQDGTLEPEHVKHLQGMYPEVYGALSKKITKKMMEARLSGEKKPPFHVRQAMGLFMGTPLDSSMTPQAIQAAQMTFAVQNQMKQQVNAAKNKKGTSSLGKMAAQFQTGEQAAASRRLSPKG